MGNYIDSLVFQPPQRESPVLRHLAFFKNKYGNQLYGIYINRHKSQTILISHGNAENLYMTLQWVERFLLKELPDCNVFLYEYSGYTQTNYLESQRVDDMGREIKSREHLLYTFIGEDRTNKEVREHQRILEKKLSKLQEAVGTNSEEAQMLTQKYQTQVQPSEKLLFADIEAAYSYLISTYSLNPQSIVLLGQSIGSGPSCYLAQKYIVGGVILISAFTSIFRILFDFRYIFCTNLFRFNLPGDKFINIDRVKQIYVPILCVHGTMDEIVPFEQSIALYTASRIKHEPFWIEGVEHNNILSSGKQLWLHIGKFLRELNQNNI